MPSPAQTWRHRAHISDQDAAKVLARKGSLEFGPLQSPARVTIFALDGSVVGSLTLDAGSSGRWGTAATGAYHVRIDADGRTVTVRTQVAD